MDNEQRKIKFKQLLAKSLGRAIVTIEREIDPKSPIFDEVILNKRRYFQAENDYNRGALKHEDRDRVFNQVSGAVLSLIEDIEEKDLVEYKNIQKEIEAFNKQIKEYETNSNSIEGVIDSQTEELKTYLVGGINSLERLSHLVEKILHHLESRESQQQDYDSMERISKDFSNMFNDSRRVFEDMEKNNYKYKEVLNRIMDNQERILSYYEESRSELHEFANKISYVIQKQTDISRELTENLIDNNSIYNERIIASLESLRNDSKDESKEEKLPPT